MVQPLQMDLIKRSKSRFNEKINFSHDTKRRVYKILINNGWNTPVFHILPEECYGKFIFKVNVFSRLPTPVELSHRWVLKNFKYQEPLFYAICFDDSSKKDLLKPLQAVQSLMK